MNYVCWKCGYEHDDPEIDLCVECGAVNPATLPIDDTATVNRSEFNRALQARLKGAGILQDRNSIVLQIGEDELLISMQKRIIFGREFHTPNKEAQMVNLDAFNAHESGVSRRHAAIHRNHDNLLMLIDLGSTNGTILNGQTLKPLQDYEIHDGDNVLLGTLHLVIRFDDKSLQD